MYLETSAKTRFGIEKFMEILVKELQGVMVGTRGRRPEQTRRQRADCQHLSGSSFQTRLLALPVGKHCRYDPILEDGSAWSLRGVEPRRLSSAGIFGRR